MHAEHNKPGLQTSSQTRKLILASVSIFALTLTPVQAYTAPTPGENLRAQGLIQKHLAQWAKTPFQGQWKSRISRSQGSAYLEMDYSVRFQNQSQASIQIDKPDNLAGFQEVRSPQQNHYHLHHLGMVFNSPQSFAAFGSAQWFPHGISTDLNRLSSNYDLRQLKPTALAGQAVDVIEVIPKHQDCMSAEGDAILCTPRRKIYLSKKTFQVLGSESFWDLGNKPFYQNFALSHDTPSQTIQPHQVQKSRDLQEFNLQNGPIQARVSEPSKDSLKALVAHLPQKFQRSFRFEKREQIEILDQTLEIWYFSDGLSVCSIASMPLNQKKNPQYMSTLALMGIAPGNEAFLIQQFQEKFLYYLPFNFYTHSNQQQIVLAQGEVPPELLQEIAENWPVHQGS